MKPADMAAYAIRSMRSRSLRSWLTILGIIVSISAMVALVGLVQGLKGNVEGQLQNFGPLTIIITPTDVTKSSSFGGEDTMTTSGKLFESDFERVKKVDSIGVITKVLSGRMNAVFKNESVSLSVYGVEGEDFKSSSETVVIAEGRFLSGSDRGAIVLGSNIADHGFRKKPELGSIISLGGENFKVVGILNKTGDTMSGIDDVAFMSLDEARAILGDSVAPNELSYIRVVLKPGSDTAAAASEIESIMLSSHRVTEDNKDFSVITASFINAQVEKTTSVLTLFLGAIAGISLVVGAIGIANTLFMAVLERRQEIGVLKAIGMGEGDILGLFLVESALLGLSGGVLGLLLGAAALGAASLLGFPAALPLVLAAGAVVFSAVVGMISGYVPARQAAELDAVEALRYE